MLSICVEIFSSQPAFPAPLSAPAKINRNAHKTLIDSIDEVYRRVRFGCRSDILGLVAIRGVGRVRAREMSDLLGVTSASDLRLLTEKDRAKLADMRGWSPKLVDNLINSANKSNQKLH